MNKYKYFIPSFIIMIIIFMFSSQDAGASSDTTLGLLSFLSSYFSIEIDSFLIRKIAHMSEFALLTLSYYYGFAHIGKKPYFMSFICSFLYACSDEFHQLFVSGRYGSILDVGIDSIGIVLMLGFIYIFKYIKKTS